MDVRQLVASLVSSLAWPVAVVVIALLARPLLLQWLRPRPSASDVPAGIEESSAAFNAYLWVRHDVAHVFLTQHHHIGGLDR